MPDPREQAEAVARWCGWEFKGSRAAFPWRHAKKGVRLSHMPPYDESLDAMREVEDEIERRGLMQRYLEELCRIVNRTTEPTTWGEIAEMMMATAEQRLQAAYEVIQREVES